MSDMFGESGGKSMQTLKRQWIVPVSSRSHETFEEAVYKAFPVHPIPSFIWPQRYSFHSDVKKLLAGMAWPNVIGWRLLGDQRDDSLSGWMRFLNSEIMHYYLPSHLIFCSILMNAGATNYEEQVAEALVLPPSNDLVVLDEINLELLSDAPVTEYGKDRVDLYKLLNEEQRRCVARFLLMYLEYHKSDFTERGIQLFQNNYGFWHDSSLPEISI